MNISVSDDVSIADTLPAEQSVQDILDEANLNCSKKKMKILLEYMDKMGATCLSDMKFLTEEDLDDILPTLQCRKLFSFIKNKENKNQSDHGQWLSQNDLSLREHSSAFNYELLKETIPSAIWNCFEKKVRLLPADRRLLIRLIATDLMSKFSNPGRKLARQVALKIVLKYPKSLADTGINGKLLGDGCGSFILQLENCLANIKRSNAQNDEEASSGNETQTQNKRNKLSSMHVEEDLQCSTMKLLPDELESCRTSLVTKFQTMDKGKDLDEETKVLLNKSFPGMRSLIMSQTSTIRELREKWPIVFTILGFGQHYQQVVAKDFKMFKENLSKCMIQFLSFMQSLQLKKKELKAVVKRINDAKGKSKDDGPEVVGMIELLSVYFNESFENIILKEPTSDVEKFSKTPCIVTHGADVYSSRSFDVFVDRSPAFQDLNSIVDALCIFFGCFYVFNIEYPRENSLTLEFLQWALAEINTVKGNNTEKSGKNRSRINGVQAKVLTLLSSMNDFCACV